MTPLSRAALVELLFFFGVLTLSERGVNHDLVVFLIVYGGGSSVEGSGNSG
jgi:hypothetical protein